VRTFMDRSYHYSSRDINFNIYVIEQNKQKFFFKIKSYKLLLGEPIYCPRGVRRVSATPRWLGLWIRIPPGAWIFVSFECCIFPVRFLCNEMIVRPKESYRPWCVVACGLETSKMRNP
jgi:hypothetical protein